MRKIVLVTEKNFEIREFAKFLRSLEQFIQSNGERSEQFLVTECFFNLLLEISHVSKIRKIIIQNGKNYWDLETCRKSQKKSIFSLSSTHAKSMAIMLSDLYPSEFTITEF